MTPEEVAEAYGEAIVDALGHTLLVPSSLLAIALALQERLEPLTQKEPTAKPATHLVTRLGRLARLANEAIAESQRQATEDMLRRTDEILKKN